MFRDLSFLLREGLGSVHMCTACTIKKHDACLLCASVSSAEKNMYNINTLPRVVLRINEVIQISPNKAPTPDTKQSLDHQHCVCNLWGSQG